MIKAMVGVSLTISSREEFLELAETISPTGMKIIKSDRFYIMGMEIDLSDLGGNVYMMDFKQLLNGLDLVEKKLMSSGAELGVCLFEIDPTTGEQI